MSGPAGTKFPKISKHNGSSQGVTFLEISKQVLELYNTRTLKKDSRQKDDRVSHDRPLRSGQVRSRVYQLAVMVSVTVIGLRHFPHWWPRTLSSVKPSRQGRRKISCHLHCWRPREFSGCRGRSVRSVKDPQLI